LAAEAMGINIAMLKTRTFAVSAMYTGLAGSLGAIAVQFVAPDSFGVFVSIFLFVGLVVGGVSSIGGTLIGAAFIEFIPNLADKVSKAAPGAVYGVLLIAVMFLLPAGAGGFLGALWRKMVHAGSRAPVASDRSDGVETYQQRPRLASMSGGPEVTEPPLATSDATTSRLNR
jgi:branched-chain amino acid transport system permease protein